MGTLYESLMKDYAADIDRLRLDIEAMEAGEFRMFKKDLGEAEVDITDDLIAHNRRTLEILEKIVAAAKARSD